MFSDIVLVIPYGNTSAILYVYCIKNAVLTISYLSCHVISECIHIIDENGAIDKSMGTPGKKQTLTVSDGRFT